MPILVPRVADGVAVSRAAQGKAEVTEGLGGKKEGDMPYSTCVPALP